MLAWLCISWSLPELFARFIPESVHLEGSDRVRQARLCLLFALGGGSVGFAGTVLHLLRGSWIIAIAFGLASLIISSTPFLLRRTGSIALAGNLIALAWFSASSAGALARGGLGGPTVLASLITPLLATLLVGSRAGLVWGGVCSTWVALLLGVQSAGVDFSDQVPSAARPLVHGVMGTAFMLLTLAIGLAYEYLKSAAMEELKQRALEMQRSEERRLHAEADARVMLAERMASIGRLAAGAAHEINNPLSYVIGNLDHLREELASGRAVSDDLRTAVDEARDGAVRIQSIVRDLKTFSRGEAQQMTTVDLHRTLDAALRIVDHEIRHRAKLIKQYRDVAMVLADDSRLAQVFVNVLLNAAQAIPVGRAQEDRIEVATARRGAQIEIRIADTGIGIPEELVGRVMDPFFTTKPIGVGTGLGLSVSRNIIESFGGTIQIESKLGLGSTVTILLQPSSQPAEAPGERATSQPPLPHARILVIDDEPLVAKSLARLLRPNQVQIVRSGAEGLAILEQDRTFDLIFCDLMMPDFTGVQVLERLAAFAPELVPRVVLVSGGSFSAARSALEGTSHRMLEKPFDQTRVRELVREQVERNRARTRESVS